MTRPTSAAFLVTRVKVFEQRREANLGWIAVTSQGTTTASCSREQRIQCVRFDNLPADTDTMRVRAPLAPFDECRSLERAFLRKHTYDPGGYLTTFVPKKFARSLLHTRTLKETSNADYAAMTAEVLGARRVV